MDNDDRIDFRLPKSERDLFFRAAEAESLPLSRWIRRTLKAAAKKVLGEADPGATHGKGGKR